MLGGGEFVIQLKILTVAMQYGRLFLHPGQRSSHSGSRNSQYGHGVVGSSASDVSGRLEIRYGYESSTRTPSQKTPYFCKEQNINFFE